MKKRVTIQMEGGLGKQIALSSLIPYFTDKYEEIIVLSSYPEVFENNPNVHRAIGYNTAFGYEEYINPSNDIYFACGYRENDFRKQRISLVQAAAQSINIPYDPDNMKPSLYTTEKEEKIVNDIKTKFGSYIIVQFSGGQNPATISQNNSPNVMAKDVSYDLAIRIIKEIQEEYPGLTILNFAIPGEFPLPGTVQLDFNYKIWFSIIKQCETFIAIDSSLQHISRAFNKKGIVLWGATNPLCFGWDHNINMENNKCSLNQYHCQRPYFVPSVDIKNNEVLWECPLKSCMKFEPKEIIENLKTLINKETLLPPTVNMNEVITGE